MSDDAAPDGPDPGLTRRHLLLSAASLGAGALAGSLPALPAMAAARPLTHGVATINVPQMLAFETAAGRFVRRWTMYRSWGGTFNLTWEAQNMRSLVQRGTTPTLTFQPQDPTQGLIQPLYSHASIVAGLHDRVLVNWAGVVAAAGGPVVVRPMHEGNGTWYPWAATVNGNTAASYVAAFRHIRKVMRAAGATNALWQWSVNKIYQGMKTPLAAIYPGDDVVDEVGFSGYNGGAELERGGWRSAAEIFEPSLDEARRICDKPLRISETGCVEVGGDKPQWITDMWSWLSRRTDVAGITWFNIVKPDVDWRVDTSPASQAAYRRGAIATIAPRF